MSSPIRLLNPQKFAVGSGRSATSRASSPLYQFVERSYRNDVSILPTLSPRYSLNCALFLLNEQWPSIPRFLSGARQNLDIDGYAHFVGLDGHQRMPGGASGNGDRA